jgi:hypothetical protein
VVDRAALASLATAAGTLALAVAIPAGKAQPPQSVDQ